MTPELATGSKGPPAAPLPTWLEEDGASLTAKAEGDAIDIKKITPQTIKWQECFIYPVLQYWTSSVTPRITLDEF
jgi:hypothetical protein